jgi:putative polymerase
MWSLFVLAPARDLDSWRYRIFAAVYMTLLLIISNSIYSIKTAALLWYLVGALDALPKAAPVESPAQTPTRHRARARLRTAWT